MADPPSPNNSSPGKAALGTLGAEQEASVSTSHIDSVNIMLVNLKLAKYEAAVKELVKEEEGEGADPSSAAVAKPRDSDSILVKLSRADLGGKLMGRF